MAAHASLSLDSSASPDHHLWRNGRLWWVAFTVHLPPWHKERVRMSLRTDDVHEARRRRDELLRRYPQERACTLSLRWGRGEFQTRPYDTDTGRAHEPLYSPLAGQDSRIAARTAATALERSNP